MTEKKEKTMLLTANSRIENSNIDKTKSSITLPTLQGQKRTKNKENMTEEERKKEDEREMKLEKKVLPSKEFLENRVKISPIERYHLDRVFRLLHSYRKGIDQQSLTAQDKNERSLEKPDDKSLLERGKDDSKTAKNKSGKINSMKDEKESFGVEDVMYVLRKAAQKDNGEDGDPIMSREEVEWMIWEMDENLDGVIDKQEYDLMYRRCIEDDTGLEPMDLFNLVQFLMYDKRGQYKITEEDTLELIYVRVQNINLLEEEVKKIFGKDNDEQRKRDGREKEIRFAEFLQQRRSQALEERENRVIQKRTKHSTIQKQDDNKPRNLL